jgi:hypothetical protein
MKIYNLDQHVSVNSDLEFIWRKLGHELDIDSLSAHSWVMNREHKHVPLVENNIYQIVEKEIWNEFYDTFRERLESYDAFLCCYPPVFALLYKRFTGKRVIVQIPIRYDFPYTDNENSLRVLNEFLLSDSVIVTANNRLDKAYFEDRTNGKKECIYIPSLCEYTGMKYAPKRDDFLLYDGSRQWRIENTVNRYDLHPHTWNDIQSFKGIIHIPYNVSTMSMFEQYTACIPMLVPSINLLMNMLKRNDSILQECFWTREQHGKYGYSTMENVLHLADFNNDEYFPHVIKFDSLYQLEEQMYDDALLEHTSKEMEKDNMLNRGKVYKAWQEVLK